MKQINAEQFLRMMQIGAQRLEQHADRVNALNVFPVPDGDTGTNMNMTIQSGIEEMKNVLVSESVGALAEALSRGLLMGARGNSGVILSQLFRGFAKALSGKSIIESRHIADAFHQGIETAYKAVIKPVEGTILTVAREAAEAGMRFSWGTKDPQELLEVICEAAQEALVKTQKMLPVLQEAGVVDAGGQGLVFIYEGMLHALTHPGELEEISFAEPAATIPLQVGHTENIDPANIEHGYCTEFMVKLRTNRRPVQPFNEQAFRQKMATFGDSLLVVADDDIVKVHIHAENPGSVLDTAMKYGDLSRIKIDNMREQHEQVIARKNEKEYGIVAIASGAGIADIFRSLGVDVVIEGGQTMNPSADEIAKAIQQVAAKEVYILPNNKNIILTAEQAVHLTGHSCKVLPTRTIPQGFSALLAFQSEATNEHNYQQMQAASKNVRSGEVTFAVRDTTVQKKEIHTGDILGIADGQIVHVGQDIYLTTQNLINEMINDETEIITIFYGQDVKENEVLLWREQLKEMFPDHEIEIHNGGQSIYYFIIAVE